MDDGYQPQFLLVSRQRHGHGAQIRDCCSCCVRSQQSIQFASWRLCAWKEKGIENQGRLEIKLTFFFSFLQRSNSSTTSQSNEAKSAQPQTLEELLERQWEQGSQFLMEQASHFDSKLTYDTVFENHTKKSHFTTLQAKRAFLFQIEENSRNFVFVLIYQNSPRFVNKTQTIYNVVK